MNDKPTFISRDMMTADEGYVQWMADKLQKVNESLTKLVTKLVTNLKSLKKASRLLAKLKTLKISHQVGGEMLITNCQRVIDELGQQAVRRILLPA